MKLFSIVFVVLSLNALTLFSQSWIYPETLVTINPLCDTTRRGEISFLHSSQFWGEGGMYIGYRDNMHRWDPTIGGTIELIGSRNWNIIFESNIHLIVDPENNIAFNPRAFAWEEGILFTTKSGNDFWHFGYQHRCKHDVDNIERLHTTGIEEQRSLIYGSAVARWDRIPFQVSGWQIYPLAEFHLYLLVQDQRFPDNTRSIESNLNAINSAIRLQTSVQHALSSSMKYGMTGDVRISSFGSMPTSKRFSGIKHVHVDPAVELFIDFIGMNAVLRCFLRYAFQSDNFVPPIPVESKLLALGIRIMPLE